MLLVNHSRAELRQRGYSEDAINQHLSTTTNKATSIFKRIQEEAEKVKQDAKADWEDIKRKLDK